MFDYLTLVFSIFLISVPSAMGFGRSIWVRMLFLLPFIMVIGNRFLVKRNVFSKEKENKRIFSLLLIVMNLQLFAIFRTSLNEEYSFSVLFGRLVLWTIVYLFGFSVFLSSRKDNNEWRLTKGIYYSVSLFVSINIILYFIGFTNPRNTYDPYFFTIRNSLLSILGIESPRVLFPLANGVNSFGIIAGISLVMSYIVLSRGITKYEKVFASFFLIASLSGVILSDSRGALMYSILTIALLTLLPRRWINSLRWGSFLIPFFPLLLSSVLELIPISLLLGFSRSGGIESIIYLGNRSVLWSSAIKQIVYFSPIHILFGYGYEGHTISGITKEFFYITKVFLSVEQLPMHNYLLQMVVDLGVIGALFNLLLYFTILGHLTHCYSVSPENNTYRMMLGAIIYLILAGTTESVPTVYSPELFTIFLYMAISSISLSVIREGKNETNLIAVKHKR